MGLFKNLFDYETKELKKIDKIVDEIEALEDEMKGLTEVEFKAKTEEFKKRLKNGETLDDILVPAFALAREACFRAIGEKPFRVQLIGGVAIHRGNIAEMKTGEGKTLTTVLPAYLNALEGKGVHVITTNEYLSTRNAEWMRPIYDLLGVTVGINTRDKSPKEKREAYDADITYTTNNELGFDYLRDNMVVHKENRTQRGLNFAIIDEVDSILIDEARTPLIISGGVAKSANVYKEADRVAKNLTIDDYVVDEKTKKVTLTEEGVHHAEEMLHLDNLYDIKNSVMVHNLDKALAANYAFKRDVDYVVENDQVIIVDTFTGRLMHGRQFSEGLHQALEAKEGVKINEETKTLATITFQNLFRMYNKLAGMTGTAKTEEEEFQNIYNTYVVCIPTNKPVIRDDQVDLIYSSLKGKYAAIVRTVKEIHKTGRPVLVGVASVETSEVISQLLNKAGIKHELLNAKNHEREAHIIEMAGQMNAITIATNMAGRGTDIKLGPGVKDIVDPEGIVKGPAGLCVIGTEINEARRIDNQLRGRSVRQGDPGYSRFYISCDDELLARFAPDYLKTLFEKMGDEALESKMVMNAITSAQKKIEGQNFDVRKSLLDYDDVLRQQRESMYKQRDTLLYAESVSDLVYGYFKTVGKKIVENSIDDSDARNAFLSGELLKKNLEPKYLPEGSFDPTGYDDAAVDEVSEEIGEIIYAQYAKKKSTWPSEAVNDIEKMVALRCVDKFWTTHIDSMAKLKEGISLRSYAQSDPLKAYVDEGWDMFNEMIFNIAELTVSTLLHAEIRMKTPEEIEQEKKQIEEMRAKRAAEAAKNADSGEGK